LMACADAWVGFLGVLFSGYAAPVHHGTDGV
jgi:hypothetical protein